MRKLLSDGVENASRRFTNRKGLQLLRGQQLQRQQTGSVLQPRPLAVPQMGSKSHQQRLPLVQRKDWEKPSYAKTNTLFESIIHSWSLRAI